MGATVIEAFHKSGPSAEGFVRPSLDVLMEAVEVVRERRKKGDLGREIMVLALEAGLDDA